MPEMEFFRERIDKTVIELLESICSADFVRLSYTEAIDILEKSGRQFEYPVAWGKDLQAEHERYLTEQEFHAPVILYDYPRGIKSFYMRLNDDGRTVRAMDILVPKVGEIIGGSQREERLDVLEARMREQGSIRPRIGGISICGATARCPIPASAWAWSACCNSSPAWATSAT